MRIAVVSAHYPPDFVSGGTLAAARVAESMQSRGHAVSVFAGSIDQAKDHQRWVSEENGIQVNWVGIHHALGWGNELNFLNPSAEEYFRRFLEEFEPDIVHFHTLQGLGASLPILAKQLGIPNVVTMHDFWWLCTRLFLVDKQLFPCPLITSAGACGCEAGIEYRLDREAFLRKALESVDLILSPSESAALVLRANGIGVGKLAVDENGLPQANKDLTGHPKRTTSEKIRFLYAGGDETLKGWKILENASLILQELPGWTLDAYGFNEDRDGIDSHRPEQVTLHRRFTPRELAEILSNSDVLVLPSIMRETYSIVTREALLAGIPVICTDTIGPEEVVKHRENGLIIPAGSSPALAAAMSTLINDKNLLESLSNHTNNVTVRSLEDQIDFLELTYADLIQNRPQNHRGNNTSDSALKPVRSDVKSVLFVAGIDGAPLRYRGHHPAEALALLGIHCDVIHYRNPRLLELAFRADAVVFYRVPATDEILAQLNKLRITGVTTLFGIDDLIFDPKIVKDIPSLAVLGREEIELWEQGVRRYRTTLENCDALITSTSKIADHCEQVSGIPSFVAPNCFSMTQGRLSEHAKSLQRTPGPLRIGYLSGTQTHQHDWLMIERTIEKVLYDFPDVEVWLAGEIETIRLTKAFGRRIRKIPSVNWKYLPTLLRDIDINLAPLEIPSVFNEAKSAIKWLEAALVETPTVASPTGPFKEVIIHGENGFLAENSDQWYEHISALLGDANLRNAVGVRAYRTAQLSYSPWIQGAIYLDILTQVKNQGPRELKPDEWIPETISEHYADAELESYPGITEEDQERHLHWTGAPAIRSLYRTNTMVSVVIPVHNGAHFLSEAIESALNQTLRPIEILAVDDASTDNSIRIIEQIKSDIPIRIIRRTANGGPGSARNEGFRNALGELIAFLDQDDVWLPNHLEELANPFANLPNLGWSYSNVDEIDEEGGLIGLEILKDFPGQHPKRTLADMLVSDQKILPSASLVSKRALIDVGGFDERLRNYENDDLFLRIFRKGYDNFYLGKPLSKIRIHYSRSAHSPKMIESRMIFADKLIEAFPDRPIGGRWWVRECIAPRFFKKAVGDYIWAIGEKDWELCNSYLEEANRYASFLKLNAKWRAQLKLMENPELFDQLRSARRLLKR